MMKQTKKKQTKKVEKIIKQPKKELEESLKRGLNDIKEGNIKVWKHVCEKCGKEIDPILTRWCSSCWLEETRKKAGWKSVSER